MATDRQKFEQAMRKWEGLYADRAFSVPQDVGRCAFIYSVNGAVSSEDEGEIEQKVRMFKAEAQQLTQACRAMGNKAVCIAGVTEENLQYVLTDKALTDVVIIGDGAFSYVYSDGSVGGSDELFDWQDVSDVADHLKTGSITKRTCGLLTYTPGVPFATFALQDHSRQYGVINGSFEPEECAEDDERRSEEEKIVRIYAEPRITYDYVRREFARPPGKARVTVRHLGTQLTPLTRSGS